MDKKTIYKLIDKFDKKQLQELIEYIVSVEESAKELLFDYCRKKESSAKTDNQVLIIESKIQQYWKRASGPDTGHFWKKTGRITVKDIGKI